MNTFKVTALIYIFIVLASIWISVLMSIVGFDSLPTLKFIAYVSLSYFFLLFVFGAYFLINLIKRILK